jgi:hypothetical protein
MGELIACLLEPFLEALLELSLLQIIRAISWLVTQL